MAGPVRFNGRRVDLCPALRLRAAAIDRIVFARRDDAGESVSFWGLPAQPVEKASGDEVLSIDGAPVWRAALDRLPPDQREALILVGASGFSYEEAAKICGCAVGTVKSRVNRARTKLAELLAIEDINEFGPDATERAVIVGQEK